MAMLKVWGHSLIGSIDEAMLGPFAGSRLGVVVYIARATAGGSRWELVGPVRQESASPLQVILAFRAGQFFLLRMALKAPL